MAKDQNDHLRIINVNLELRITIKMGLHCREKMRNEHCREKIIYFALRRICFQNFDF